MSIIKWSPLESQHPWGAFPTLQSRVNRLFDEFFRDEETAALTRWSPRVDVVELEDKYEFTAELPGLTKDDVRVEVHQNQLSITGEKKSETEKKDQNYHLTERSYGRFCRTFQLPGQVNIEDIQAEFKDGVLKIDLAKREEAKPKQVEISIK